MNDDTFTPSGPPPPTGPNTRQRRRYLLPVAAALFGLASLAAACSSGPSTPGVQGAGSGTPTTGASTANQGPPTLTPAQRAAQLAYSQCMQAHGIHDFPDPNGQGQLLIQGGSGSDLNPNNAAFSRAQRACQSKLPKPTAAQQAQAEQNALRVSRCMRAHGIKDYPDPSTTGGKVSLQISGGPGSDLNPNDPLFQAAQKACMPNAPKLRPGAGNATTNGGGSGGIIAGGN